MKEAVGFDEARGDSYTTAVMEFTVPEVVEDNSELEAYEQKEFILTIVKYVIQGLSVVAVVGVLFLILKRSEKALSAARERKAEAENLVEERARRERDKVREEVLAAVQSDPVVASEILHEWLEKEEAVR